MKGSARMSPNTTVCPGCGSSRLWRSRSQSLKDRLWKRFTEERPHRCHDCGWRGWMKVLEQTNDHERMALDAGTPDLDSIDAAWRNQPPKPGNGRS